MSKLSLTNEMVSLILPTPNLDDLSHTPSDIDNDIEYLLEWLAPCFPPALSRPTFPPAANRLKDPSPRVRAAFRSCLKDTANQLQFCHLYVNSINRNCALFFENHDFPGLVEKINIVKTIVSYYASHAACLNLNTLARDLLLRNLNATLYAHLIAPCESDFWDSVKNLLSKSMFNDTALSNSPSGVPPLVNLIDIFSTLHSINLGPRIHSILIHLSVLKIKLYISRTCAAVFDKPRLHLIDDFVRNNIYPNFSVIISITGNSSISADLHSIYFYELVKIARDELVALRASEIYDIVLQYPHSAVALSELHQCLLVRYNHKEFRSAPVLTEADSTTGPLVPGLSNAAFLANASIKTQASQRVRLVKHFTHECHCHLLHAGANTVHVIGAYTKTIRAFLIIDPKGVLLDKVARPIRHYLKGRQDVVAKLVNGMLAQSPDAGPLAELATELGHHHRSHSQVANPLYLEWVPDPIDALPDFKREKVTDIIESLISIFDSPQVFVREFSRLISERLLAVHDYNIADIVTQVDLLKARFGETDFVTLDVMIQDIRDSHNVNHVVRRLFGNRGTSFHSSILSHMYWPMFADGGDSIATSAFKVPRPVVIRFDQFRQAYSEIKPGRMLKLVTHLGTVSLVLHFAGKPAETYSVTPAEYAIIHLFDNVKHELSIDHIKESLRMSHYMVTKGLEFWVKRGVLLALTKTLYIVNEDDDDGEAPSALSPFGSPTIAADSPAPPDSPNPPLHVLWPYVASYFENIERVSAPRLHHFLARIVPKDVLDFALVTDQMWQEYLDWLIDKDHIICVDGCFYLSS